VATAASQPARHKHQKKKKKEPSRNDRVPPFFIERSKQSALKHLSNAHQIVIPAAKPLKKDAPQGMYRKGNMQAAPYPRIQIGAVLDIDPIRKYQGAPTQMHDIVLIINFCSCRKASTPREQGPDGPQQLELGKRHRSIKIRPMGIRQGTPRGGAVGR